MKKIINHALIYIILLTPLIRIINGSVDAFGDVVQLGFLGLYILWLIIHPHTIKLFIINVIGILLVMLSLVTYGFDNEAIKILILSAVICLSLDSHFGELMYYTIKNNQKVMIGYLFILTAVFAGLLLNPDSYYLMYGISYFRGNLNHPHAMAYTVSFLLLLSVTLAAFYKKPWLYIMTLIPLYIINLAGVRTMAVAFGGSLIIYAISKVKRLRDIFIYAGIGFLVVYVLMTYFSNLAIVEKFLLTNDDISSGRTTFWVFDILAWWRSGLVGVWFGNGFSFVYEVNMKYFFHAIGAHNDFISIASAMGITGLIYYTYLYISYAKRVPLAILFIFVSLAGLNGFFGYSELVFFIPIPVIWRYYHEQENNSTH